MQAFIVSEEEMEMHVARGATTDADIEDMTADDLARQDLTEADRESLLAGAPVSIGAICLCPECQDNLEEVDGEPE